MPSVQHLHPLLVERPRTQFISAGPTAAGEYLYLSTAYYVVSVRVRVPPPERANVLLVRKRALRAAVELRYTCGL